MQEESWEDGNSVELMDGKSEREKELSMKDQEVTKITEGQVIKTLKSGKVLILNTSWGFGIVYGI